MAAVTAAVAATASTAYSIYAGERAANRAGDARNAQLEAQNRAIEMQQQYLDWSMGQYDQWRSEFSPILDQLKMEAAAGRTPDYASIAADTQAAFASARNQGERRNQRYGVRASDGQAFANERMMSIGEATAEVSARASERRSLEDDRFRRLGTVYGIGAGLQSSAMGMVGGAYGGASNAYSNLAGMHGGQAGFHNNQANQYGQIAAQSGASAFGQWADIIEGAMGVGNQAPTPDAFGGGPGSFYGIPAPEGTSGIAPWAPGGG